MKLKMQRIAMAVCGLALGTGIAQAQAKDFSPLGLVEKDGAIGQVETVPEHGGTAAFTAIGLLGIFAWMLFRKLRRQYQ